MTPAEFKSWFEGFTEAFTGCPSKAQWARIKERVGEIDGKPITEVRYIDHYIHRYWPSYINTPYVPFVYPYYSCGVGTLSGGATLVGNQNQLNDGHSVLVGASNTFDGVNNTFDGVVAMNALGRAEASLLSR